MLEHYRPNSAVLNPTNQKMVVVDVASVSALPLASSSFEFICLFMSDEEECWDSGNSNDQSEIDNLWLFIECRIKANYIIYNKLTY